MSLVEPSKELNRALAFWARAFPDSSLIFLRAFKLVPMSVPARGAYLGLVSGPAVPDDQLSIEGAGDQVSAVPGKVAAGHLGSKTVESFRKPSAQCFKSSYSHSLGL